LRPLKKGTQAPDFTLPDQHGHPFTLSKALATHAVVLYFYPKDETFGCTIESCAFRDAYEAFVEAGAVVVGISTDSIASHQQFIQHHQLPFTLLSDPDKTVHLLYGVDKGAFGLIKARVTFVIDKKSIIQKTFDSLIDFKGHVSASLKVLKEL
jgi:thioredoxin-dependent peroxiredoxin